jgi:glycosyltransferase involved in cell wall biosynthesis
MASMTAPGVSVVVATLNRCNYLRLCLDALARQTAASESFEVIVVDNGSTDETAEVVRGFCDQGRNVSYVREERPGLSVARNSGLRRCGAEISAFTDDDALPDPQWVERIASRYAMLGQEVVVLGGEVRPIWEAPRPDWLTNELLRPLSAGLLWSPTARLLRNGESLMGVNIAYRKSRLLEFGGFAEQFGHVGDTLLSCEDCVNLLMTRAGLQAYYDPSILVGHHIHASRLTRGWFRRRYFWQGVSTNRVHNCLEQMSAALNIPQPLELSSTREIVLPASAAAWADLFDDCSDSPLEQQVLVLEQLGYLLQSQSVIAGS